MDGLSIRVNNGIELICQRTYSDGIKKRFFFNERDERIENKEVFEYVE